MYFSNCVDCVISRACSAAGDNGWRLTRNDLVFSIHCLVVSHVVYISATESLRPSDVEYVYTVVLVQLPSGDRNILSDLEIFNQRLVGIALVNTCFSDRIVSSVSASKCLVRRSNQNTGWRSQNGGRRTPKRGQQCIVYFKVCEIIYYTEYFRF